VSEPVFLIINATPNKGEAKAHDEYLQMARPISARHGAVRVANYLLSEALDGQSHASNCIVVSFPTRQSIYDLFADPDYQALIALRNTGFAAVRYFIGSERIH
jgi:uncharacterized protein (DUF1330 family)